MAGMSASCKKENMKLPPKAMKEHMKKEKSVMKKQGYNDKMDESLGSRHGKKSQSMKDRRDESKGMSKASGKRAYSSVKSMDKSKKK